MLTLVAGWNLKNAQPRVWDNNFPEFFLPELQAIMVSYADFHSMPSRRKKAMENGLHKILGVPKTIRIYLDNGSFHFLNKNGEVPRKEYEEFIEFACPDWYPIPQDYIPTPKMSSDEQNACFKKTMEVNEAYQGNSFVPVIHVGKHLEDYAFLIKMNQKILAKPNIAIGGIVPNLLRAPKALPHKTILGNLIHIRQEFADKKIHVFGIGGTATIHIAALLNIDSVDSGGWRTRAARGIVQLPGSGDRSVADLGKWKGRKPSPQEWKLLKACECPACQEYGISGLKANKVEGFRNRATHNLWVLLREAQLVQHHIDSGTYTNWYEEHLDNSIYKPLVKHLLEILDKSE